MVTKVAPKSNRHKSFWKKSLKLYKTFWKVNGCPDIINDNNIDPEHSSKFDSAMPMSINNSENQPVNINLKGLTNVRLKNWNGPIIVELNINSVWNNFDFLCSEVSPNIDLLLVSETKLDDSFKTVQFSMISFYRPYGLDRCSNRGGLLLYITEDIPSHLLTEYKLKKNVECFFCGN